MKKKFFTKKWLIWELEEIAHWLNYALSETRKNKLLNKKKFKVLEEIFADLIKFIEEETGKNFWELSQEPAKKGKKYEEFLRTLKEYYN